MVAHVLYPTFFMTIVYYMAGFRSFLFTVLTILLIAMTSQVSTEKMNNVFQIHAVVEVP